MTWLRDIISKSFIVCYKEDITHLEFALKSSGLHPEALRASYTSDELLYPANTRCFMAHRGAWKLAADAPGYTLICEADFVPCQGLGDLPVFWPLSNSLAWGYLYQGSPRLLSVIGSGRLLRGHCAPLVAYVINPSIAKLLLRFYEEEIEIYGKLRYFTFDAHLQWWLMGQGAEAYIPMKHYGEHGGLPNTEHAKMGLVNRAGRHRADNLAGPLAFLPQYARGSRSKYCIERIKARAFGWGRLLTGRWIVDTNVYSRNWRNTLAMQWTGLRRLMS